MATHLMVAGSLVAVQSTVDNISEQHDQITRASDFLFQGYEPAVM